MLLQLFDADKTIADTWVSAALIILKYRMFCILNMKCKVFILILEQHRTCLVSF